MGNCDAAASTLPASLVERDNNDCLAPGMSFALMLQGFASFAELVPLVNYRHDLLCIDEVSNDREVIGGRSSC